MGSHGHRFSALKRRNPYRCSLTKQNQWLKHVLYCSISCSWVRFSNQSFYIHSRMVLVHLMRLRNYYVIIHVTAPVLVIWKNIPFCLTKNSVLSFICYSFGFRHTRKRARYYFTRHSTRLAEFQGRLVEQPPNYSIERTDQNEITIAQTCFHAIWYVFPIKAFQIRHRMVVFHLTVHLTNDNVNGAFSHAPNSYGCLLMLLKFC